MYSVRLTFQNKKKTLSFTLTLFTNSVHFTYLFKCIFALNITCIVMSLRIKEIIKAKGTSVQDLAEKMGISRVGLSQHINGNPSVEVLERIAEALGVEISELFTSSNKEELTALIQHKDEFYKASTLEELENIITKIKGEGRIPDHENIRGKEYYK